MQSEYLRSVCCDAPIARHSFPEIDATGDIILCMNCDMILGSVAYESLWDHAYAQYRSWLLYHSPYNFFRYDPFRIDGV